jgi:hypothetical protein
MKLLDCYHIFSEDQNHESIKVLLLQLLFHIILYYFFQRIVHNRYYAMSGPQ